jgi:hypothetical protein
MTYRPEGLLIAWTARTPQTPYAVWPSHAVLSSWKEGSRDDSDAGKHELLNQSACEGLFAT